MPNEVHVVADHTGEALCGRSGDLTDIRIPWEWSVRASGEGHIYDGYVDMWNRNGYAVCSRCDEVARRLITIYDENAENVVPIRLKGTLTTRPRSHALRSPFDLTRFCRLSTIEQAIRKEGAPAHVLKDIEGRFQSGLPSSINGAALELSIYGLLREVHRLSTEFQPDEGDGSKPDMKLTWQQGTGVSYSQPSTLHLEATYINPAPTHLDSRFVRDVCDYIWELDIPGWKAVIAPIDGEVFNPVPRDRVQEAVRARLADLNPADYEVFEVSPLDHQGIPAMTLKLIDANKQSVDIRIDFMPAPGSETLHGWGGGGGASISSPIDPIRSAIKRKLHQHSKVDPLIIAMHYPEANRHEVERALYGAGLVLPIDSTDRSRTIEGWWRMDGIWKPESRAHENSHSIPRPLAVLWCDSPFKEVQSPPVLYVPPSMDTTYLGPLLDAFPVRYLASEVRTL